MSLQDLANSLQNQGRGNDSMLVHMTPNEVAGLQSLALAHGGSLTTNPTTGLTEAGVLEDILPSIAGIGAGMLGLGPLGVGLASGLTSYATNRDPNRALMSGLLSGGVSGLMSGAERFDPAIEKAAAEQAELINKVPSVQDIIASREDPTAMGEWGYETKPMAYPSEAGLPAGSTYKNPVFTNNAVSMTPEQAATERTELLENAINPAKGGPTAPTPSAWEGIKNIASNPTTLGKDFLLDNKYSALAAGAGLVGMMSPQQTAAPGPQAKTGYAPQYTWNPQTRRYEDAPARPYTYYAANGGAVPYPAGGIGYPQQNVMDKTDFYAQSTANPTPTSVIGAAPKTDYDARITQQGDEFKAAGGGKIYSRKPTAGSIYEYDDPLLSPEVQEDLAFAKLWGSQKYAHGGIASLGEYAAGGKLLKGPGDGMSDSIPAVIKGPKPQRAALAQGEFVIPADVVSHLGNGSTDAGAKRLYSMMDKIRMARTGSKKQGRQINPAKFMPA